ncbi:MAG TPA: hypothetical protein DIC64_04730 [Alphaproteobacteria bacterium]|nr:hypothetical protein [Alphaproteobacteria bacterium]
MLIKCPKCQVVYELDDSLVPENGLKMRCNSCGEVFKAYPEDAVDDEQTAAQKKLNIINMFKRFAGEKEDLFTPDTPDVVQNRPPKVRIVHLTHYKNSINYLLILLLLVLMAAFMYFLRYDIVRFVPKAESLYNRLGIESIYDGSQLQFSNIKTEEFVAGSVSKIKVSGVIDNPTVYEMNVLPVKVVVYDQYDNKLLDTTHYLPQTRTRPNYKLPFEVVITNPTPEKKNIHITFADNL